MDIKIIARGEVKKSWQEDNLNFFSEWAIMCNLTESEKQNFYNRFGYGNITDILFIISS